MSMTVTIFSKKGLNLLTDFLRHPKGAILLRKHTSLTVINGSRLEALFSSVIHNFVSITRSTTTKQICQENYDKYFQTHQKENHKTRNINYYVPSFVDFPSLKTLKLASIVFEDENSLSNLVSASPALEDFYQQRTFEASDNLDEDQKIQSPTLEYLHLAEDLAESVLPTDFPCLTEADII
ncbi:Leucine-rich repeat 2 [Dillenia turbinata]|uniref:Leucine-rich repeat 2 n=1 Tax=Dillenia turbinata TaxID=194707 RepID=A0AAN8VQW8_9MAGN